MGPPLRTKEAMASMAPPEDDPVVCEIPVHLAENLRGQLYMVQFPLRPAYRPMPLPPRQARVKPANQILQLDYEVDQRGEHYDRDAEDYLKQKYQRLQSTTVPALTNYAVGAFRQGQLHLTPVQAVMQMRPSLAHIDAAADEEEEDMEVEEPAQPPAPEIKEVQFQFKKKQSERAINAIQNSYAYKKQQINAEHWRELKVMDQSGIDDEFENLFSEREDEVVSGMTAEEYLKALRYRSVADDAAPTHPAQTNVDMEEKEESDVDTIAHARASINPKYVGVYQVLATDHVLHFDALAALLPSVSEEELAEALENVAVSLHGALLAKSSLVCSGEVAASARDRILKELRSHPKGVKRADLADKYALDADATKKTLEDIADLDKVTRMWRLRGGADRSFARRFPGLAKEIEL